MILQSITHHYSHLNNNNKASVQPHEVPSKINSKTIKYLDITINAVYLKLESKYQYNHDIYEYNKPIQTLLSHHLQLQQLPFYVFYMSIFHVITHVAPD